MFAARLHPVMNRSGQVAGPCGTAAPGGVIAKAADGIRRLHDSATTDITQPRAAGPHADRRCHRRLYHPADGAPGPGGWATTNHTAITKQFLPLGHSATRPLGHFPKATWPLDHFRFAFTIVELLVVLSLMGILVTLAWPTLQNLTGSNRLESAVGSVSVAAKAMRNLATRPFPSAADEVTNAAYDGTAMVFIREPGTLDLRIRLTYNNQHAKRTSTGEFLESLIPARNGFTDLHGITDFGVPDPIRIPNGMAVAGIIAPTSTDPHLVDLPFALRFSFPTGQLLALTNTITANLDQLTYYDYRGKTVDVGGGRSYQAGNGLFTNDEGLFNVIGVVVYDIAKARTAGFFRNPIGSDPVRVPYQLLVNGSDEVTVTLAQLVNQADGRVIFFSRYSGAAVIEGAQR